jgi:hypothetical protein
MEKLTMSETTLYNIKGLPIAYIAKDHQTIYLWNGIAVAYLHENKIYGFNGSHLGWFEDFIARDLNGYKVGFIKSTCPCMTKLEKIKSIKKLEKIKSIKKIPKIKPVNRNHLSSIMLEVLLQAGSK